MAKWFGRGAANMVDEVRLWEIIEDNINLEG